MTLCSTTRWIFLLLVYIYIYTVYIYIYSCQPTTAQSPKRNMAYQKGMTQLIAPGCGLRSGGFPLLPFFHAAHPWWPLEVVAEHQHRRGPVVAPVGCAPVQQPGVVEEGVPSVEHHGGLAVGGEQGGEEVLNLGEGGEAKKWRHSILGRIGEKRCGSRWFR